MLWRLSNSLSIQDYIQGDSPCSVVVYSENSEELCVALCAKLLSYNFDLIIVAVDSDRPSNLRDQLQLAYPRRNITSFAVAVEDSENTMQQISDAALAKNVTLAVSCLDAEQFSRPLETHKISPTQSYSSVVLFVNIQNVVLLHLIRSNPSGLLLVANTLSPAYHEAEDFLKSFTSGISRQLQSMGHNEVQVTFMEYYGGSERPIRTISRLSPTPDALSDSILRTLGHTSTHVIPYWPHELLAWVVWFLMLLLPVNLVEKLIPI